MARNNDFPTIKAYREIYMARPAWKEAPNKGDGYDWKGMKRASAIDSWLMLTLQ